MRKIFIMAVFALVSTLTMAQEKCFGVFFTDRLDTQGFGIELVP